MVKRKIQKRASRKSQPKNMKNVEEQLTKFAVNNIYQHKYSHYCFECEVDVNDDAQELTDKFRDLHF